MQRWRPAVFAACFGSADALQCIPLIRVSCLPGACGLGVHTTLFSFFPLQAILFYLIFASESVIRERLILVTPVVGWLHY